ncbi:MAG: hypothetical protein IKG69_09830 [Atopobiaceae bacterium]|nr:hypothetical protein [Atopobiaceae bacterium]MBR3385479.1 hypothetical protein [Atopobiaceae bacterium]
MPAEIVTGYAGEPHVTPAQDGRRNVGTFGPGRYVLGTGQAFAITVESANAVTIGTGDGIMDGRHVTVEVPTSLSVESGTQGVSRNDLVCMRYTANPTTGIEAAELVVIAGTPTSGTASDPAYNAGSILEGATTVDWPLWRLPLAGVTVGTPVRLFDEVSPLAVLAELLSSHAHGAGDITSGTLPVARGGTGAASVDANRVFAGPNGSVGAPVFRALAAADIPNLPAGKITSGLLAVARGGTGLGTAPSLLVNLASTGAASVLQASPRPGVTGTLPVARGGTGATSVAAARHGLGLAYAAGETVASTFRGTGFITSSKKSLVFTLPLAQRMDGTPRATNMRVKAIQGGHYIVGSSTASANLTSATTVGRRAHGLDVSCTIPAHADAVNNDVCGIVAEYEISFS